jgi:flagellar biosynthesis/type III secretory pathway protein FliH
MRTNCCAVMSDEFVPLALFLRPTVSEAAAAPMVLAAPPPADSAPRMPEHDEALRAARRFRAALADALESALEELLRAIASDVLARELQLGDTDIAAIVAAVLKRFAGHRILSVRAHPQDCAALAILPVEHVTDDSLTPGDVRVELQCGTIDLTLDARLDAVLAAWAA